MKDDQIASRMQGISPFYVMDLLAQAKKLETQGHDVIHLEVGEPDFPTSQIINNAAIQAIESGYTKYTAATGLPELKSKISEYYRQRLNATVKPDNIIITPGASGALQLALSVLINSGQNVLMADPGYPCNRHFVRLLDACAQTIPVDADTRYQLTHQLIETNWQDNTAAVLLASPSNPTGTLIGRDEMQKIINLVKKKKGFLLVDEIYQGLVYDQMDFSAAELSSDVFVINSFSKFFTMTGWRLGWLVVPDAFIEPVDRLAQNLFLSPPTVSQYAALSAFNEETLKCLDAQRDELNKRREFLLAGLISMGFKINVKPGGAFYIYADVSKFTHDSFKFCNDLLHQSHVAITPGIDFGEHQANRYVRFAYTQNIEKLQMALDRIGDFLSNYRHQN
ncbi:MAG: pyridoxal phosphate-dependent aminotransferase [endosymbiont of Galathealinum brachiosum]|uniref:Pyridoxal phosphate-dependent aminotransferase n=1 Tax=endosymbiont of Galathealinum brachiosum TaxID=2200906 RepID=A0A370D8M8_9GAMM|nr:MAG: pyridoxal phosphate-dependent aminotransferase [endosymbiont of Galathealinum brachiosum]